MNARVNVERFAPVKAAAVHNQLTGGSILYFGSLPTNRAVPSGALVDFPVGTITFSEL